MRLLRSILGGIFAECPAPSESDGRCDVLFILKHRGTYGYGIADETFCQSTGLWNSATYVVEMLEDLGFRAAVEIAVDNNCIDRLVALHRPRAVIIEALWVAPEKFDELAEIHPDVKWCVRIHSEMPFMAGESIALGWLDRYLSRPGVSISANSPRMHHNLSTFLGVSTLAGAAIDGRLHYLPNAYPPAVANKRHHRRKYWVDVGCFGAIRPLKNHVTQAIAAVEFAMANDKQLRFHINGARDDAAGAPILANLRGMFEALAKYGHRLVEHEWLPRDEFLALCGTMDVGLQASLSETFNIVAADITAAGVPLVGSGEIPWLADCAIADPADSSSIASALQFAWSRPRLVARANAAGLADYSKSSRGAWARFVSELA